MTSSLQAPQEQSTRYGDFPILEVPYWGPYHKDYSIVDSMLGYAGNHHMYLHIFSVFGMLRRNRQENEHNWNM